jgi:putative ABC transport system substrate-binding protein
MNRRVFLTGLGTVLAIPQAAAPQEAKKVARVGYLAAVSAAADAPRAEAFRQGLRDLGYIEGQNINVLYRYEASAFERLPELAAELVRLKIDVLVTVTTNAAIACKMPPERCHWSSWA